MIQDVRVGIPFVGHANWMGGVYWACNLIKAVYRLPRTERPKIYFWLTEPYAAHIDLYADILPLVDGIIQLGANWKMTRFREKAVVSPTSADFFSRLDLIVPVLNDIQHSNFPSITWIPDFQHIHMPEMFSEKERKERDDKFSAIAARAPMVIFSSKSALADWSRFFPHSKAVTRILHFQTIPEADWFKPDPEETRLKYGLPSNYLICCNQFWMHKNHGTLFQAIADLHRRGIMARLVCTGNTDEYRNKEYFPSLKGMLGQLGIIDHVQILGQIPRGEQIALVRRSMAVIQPSLFEGWSTVVEDARLLGKTIFMSDLDVHKEQAPPYGHYFARRDPADLARQIADRWGELRCGPDTDREAAGRSENERAIEAYGRRFAEIINEAIFVMGLRPGGATRRADDLLRVPLSAEVLDMSMRPVKPALAEPPKHRPAVISLAKPARPDVGSLGGQAAEPSAAPQSQTAPQSQAAAAGHLQRSGIQESCDSQTRQQADAQVVKLIQAGRFGDAVGLLQKQSQVSPADGKIRSNLGWALAQMARRTREMALHRLTYAFVLNPAKSGPRKNLAVMLIGLALRDDARCLYEKAMQMCPDDQSILQEAYSLGLKFDAVASRSDGEVDDRIARANDELRAANQQAAPRDAGRPEDLSGQTVNPELHLKALNFAKEGKIDQAVEALTEFARQNPRHVDAHSDLGVLNFQQSMTLAHLATGHFHEAIRLGPHDIAPYKNLACLLMETGQLGKSHDAWQAVADRNPFDRDAQAGMECVRQMADRAKT
ncbi:MAG: glycosyltransferase [Planctomycetes bacterium]|nr:glycosyltransferase [Planctomycetota bacterium]